MVFTRRPTLVRRARLAIRSCRDAMRALQGGDVPAAVKAVIAADPDGYDIGLLLNIICQASRAVGPDPLIPAVQTPNTTGYLNRVLTGYPTDTIGSLVSIGIHPQVWAAELLNVTTRGRYGRAGADRMVGGLFRTRVANLDASGDQTGWSDGARIVDGVWEGITYTHAQFFRLALVEWAWLVAGILDTAQRQTDSDVRWVLDTAGIADLFGPNTAGGTA